MAETLSDDIPTGTITMPAPGGGGVKVGALLTIVIFIGLDRIYYLYILF
jgi:hypothetical protein